MTSLIIPVYTETQGLVDMTDRCLTSILRHTPPNVEVIIVDDGSTIPYKANIGKLITLEENGGYSKAVNTALEAAQGDILVIGNNDLTFHENWLPELLFPLNVGFDIATCWTSDQRNIKLQDKIQKDAVFGSLLAMTRQTYETIGGFDEQFRGYFADTDYRKRALSYGIKIGKNMNMVVQHEAKATYAVTDPTDYEFHKASFLFEEKWGEEE